MPTLIVTTHDEEVITMIQEILDQIPGEEEVDYRPGDRPQGHPLPGNWPVEIGYVRCDDGSIHWACAEDTSRYQIFHSLMEAYAACP